MEKKVLISGAGPAGLTAAILLDKERYAVTLVEKGSTYMSMGFAIILWQAGYKILESVLGHQLYGLHPLRTFHIYGGSDISRLQGVDTGGKGYSLVRKDLVDQLARKYMKQSESSSTMFNTEITCVTKTDSNRSKVEFSNGTTDEFDIVVLADGMHSRLRDEIFLTEVEVKPLTIDYAWISSKIDINNQALLGFDAEFMYLIQSVGDKTLIALYNHAGKPERDKFLKKLANNLDFVPSGEITIDEQTMRGFQFEKVSTDTYYHDNVVLIGDSLHGHPPTLAMGTTLALEDAFVLSDALNNPSNTEIRDAFEEYVTTRKPRIKDVFATQDMVERFFLTNSNLLVNLDVKVLKYGGWPLIEKKLRDIFTSSIV